MTQPTKDHPATGPGWLQSFSRELRRVDDYDALVDLVRSEMHARFGITNAWLYVFQLP